MSNKLAFQLCAALLLTSPMATHSARIEQAPALLIVEKTDGPVTAREIEAFKSFLGQVPVPTNNLHNALVYGSGGAAAEALGRMVEVSGDRALLDRMLDFTDAMLAARNDEQTGALLWTGARELVWPNQEPQAGKALYSSTENGDISGHIAYAAQLILQDPKLWNLPVAGGDPHNFGATYRERALRYVREMDRTMDGFVLKWLVRPDSLRYYAPNSPLYEAATKPGAANQPVPWNQQMMLNNGFGRLAECHRLLGDDAPRVQRYEAIVKASVDWFFAAAQRITVQGHPCYKWSYVFQEPLRNIEDIGHSGEDVSGLYRAYRSGRYGITAAQMEPLANTVLYVMRNENGKFSTRVDGTSNPKGHPPGGLGSKWMELCEFAPELYSLLYEINRGRFKNSPDHVAAFLWHKHRRAAKHLP